MPSPDLIEAYLEHLRQLDRSPRTIGDRQRILTVADQELPCGLDSACEAELRTWLYRPDWSPASKQTYLGALRSFYRWAVEADVLERDPVARLERPRIPRPLPRPVTDEQLHQVLTTAVEPHRLCALLAAYAGLRCIEISRLERGQISEQEIRVHGKGGKPGVVPTHPRVWQAVRHLPPGPVVPDDEPDEWLRARRLSISFALYCRHELRLPGVALHRFRHWAGTEWQRATGDVRVTQELLRHASINSTMIYTAVSDERRRAAVLSLPSVAGGESGPDPDAAAVDR